ncbi:tRNA-uridine aminocarboxypropyltransferase [Bacteriovorax sp. Seq25_V]|uniref:tRNA-uridine aminocarboxypropyltransferase n=1 Tax=Bacteriovorax sp. Seq25_V TaxID=1201288 RepID=UPI000389F373|nr:tRNA-uridine aminocarboxypropyltransferase [Bacteriovorax sp. Seq25_V]EQC44344.1 DTW domain protein [Bacteriovorax sp. Seq25_V]
MKKTRRETFSGRCEVCRINKPLCFCSHIPKLDNKVEVLVVMHFTERWLTSNTAYFANLVLNNSKIIERGNLNSPMTSEQFVKEEKSYLYLFPTEDSKPIEEFKGDISKAVLVVPDGSWSKAKKFHKREECLKALPKYHLSNVGKSNYQLRKSPGEDFLCTYEAIAKALGSLEGKEIENQMLNFFDIFVDRVLRSRRGEQTLSNP